MAKKVKKGVLRHGAIREQKQNPDSYVILKDDNAADPLKVNDQVRIADMTDAWMGSIISVSNTQNDGVLAICKIKHAGKSTPQEQAALDKVKLENPKPEDHLFGKLEANAAQKVVVGGPVLCVVTLAGTDATSGVNIDIHPA